ncbi:MAG: hypothetical protein IJ301_01855 [Clostridia bacterium]|nr:hypothetical protein [Clostridia bacterium]
MENRKTAYKTVNKIVLDKKTGEGVEKKFVYADMENASPSERETIQMLVNAGYEYKKWKSVKTPGITAEKVLQFLKDNKKAEEEKKFLEDFKRSENFMNIISEFNENFAPTKKDRDAIKNIVPSVDVQDIIGKIKKEKIEKRKTKAKETSKRKRHQKKLAKERAEM